MPGRRTIWMCLLLGLLIYQQRICAQSPGRNAKRITVSADGKADHKSIQAAINSLPDSAAEPTVIYIKKGIYKEKLYIEKHNIIFLGEDRNSTIITQSIARDEWRCRHN